MARIDVVMPQMGESIAEGTVSRWIKKVGDAVKRDEPMFEISTDKVDAEIQAPATGVLVEILVPEGKTVAIETVVARLETDAAAAADAKPSLAPAPAVASAPVAAASPGPKGGDGNAGASSSAPAAAPLRAEAGTLEHRLRTKSSPLVRRIAAEHGIDVSGLRGSGVADRVTKRDLMQAIEARSAGGTVGPSMYAPGGVSNNGPLPEAWPGDVVEPMSVMRQKISEHMIMSRRTSAHVTAFMEVDLTRVARIRAARRAEFEAATGTRPSYLPFIIRSVVEGLKAHPVLNASIAGSNVIYRKQFNIGIAVALDWGLIVPVIKGADALSLVGITKSLYDLATRARAKKLSPSEVQDGTFTVTNPGVFGSLMGTPIINQPQVAILGIGAIEKRPKVMTGPDGEDVIAIRTCAYFSISFDHRIIDGAVADQFLAKVKRSLETLPETVS